MYWCIQQKSRWGISSCFPKDFSKRRFSDEKAWFLQELLEWYVFSDCGDGTDLRLAGLSRVYVDVSLGRQCPSSWRSSGFSTRMPNEYHNINIDIKLAKDLCKDMDGRVEIQQTTRWDRAKLEQRCPTSDPSSPPRWVENCLRLEQGSFSE